jgi:kynurenine formamidase
MCGNLDSFVFEPILERDGVSVSRSPWGPDDEIGRLNWITPEATADVLSSLDGRHVFDLAVEYFKGMPSWTAAGDPLYDIWMTHTPDGAVIDGLAGAEPRLLEKYSYSGDAMQMYVHCGTHLDTLNHFGHFGMYWNGWTAKQHLGSRHWLKGGAEHYPPIIARGTLLDVAGLHGVDCLPPCYEITPDDLKAAARRQGVEPRPREIVHIRTGRMTVWPDVHGYITDQPGIGLPAARYLCEEVGAMCIAGDSLSVEVVPNPDPELFLPVHSYMFSTAGAQIIEVVNYEELAAEGIWQFAFLGFPLKLRGATGSPLRPVAVPLRGA